MIFTHKIQNQNYPPLNINNNRVEQPASHKNQGLTLEHLDVSKTVSKTIGLTQKFQKFYLLFFFFLYYNFLSFIKLQLDSRDTIYNQVNICSFHLKLESIQYDAALEITGATRRTFEDKMYLEQSPESL